MDEQTSELNPGIEYEQTPMDNAVTYVTKLIFESTRVSGKNASGPTPHHTIQNDAIRQMQHWADYIDRQVTASTASSSAEAYISVQQLLKKDPSLAELSLNNLFTYTGQDGAIPRPDQWSLLQALFNISSYELSSNYRNGYARRSGGNAAMVQMFYNRAREIEKELIVTSEYVGNNTTQTSYTMPTVHEGISAKITIGKTKPDNADGYPALDDVTLIFDASSLAFVRPLLESEFSVYQAKYNNYDIEYNPGDAELYSRKRKRPSITPEGNYNFATLMQNKSFRDYMRKHFADPPPRQQEEAKVASPEENNPIIPPTDYEILGVSPEATDAEIRSAFRKLSFMFHPDRNQSPEAKEISQMINGAKGKIEKARGRRI